VESSDKPQKQLFDKPIMPIAVDKGWVFRFIRGHLSEVKVFSVQKNGKLEIKVTHIF